jgi:hypothetical protein
LKQLKEKSMRRTIHGVFIAACAVVFFASCSSSPAPRMPKAVTWCHFPITVVSGTVSVSASGFILTDNRLWDFSYFIFDRDAAQQASRRVAEYNSRIVPTTLTRTFSERVNKTAGDTIVYLLRKGETASVSLAALDGDAVIECSGIEYTLAARKPGVTLSFRD